MDISAQQLGLIQDIARPMADNIAQATKNEAAAQALIKDCAGKLAALEKKVKQAHGPARLINPFIRAAKIEPLRWRKNRLADIVITEKAQTSALAEKAFVTIGEILVKGSSRGYEYAHLKKDYDQVDSTQSAVRNALAKCDTACSQASWASMGDEPNMSVKDAEKNMWTPDAADAARSIMDAQSVAKALLKDMPGFRDSALGAFAAADIPGCTLGEAQKLLGGVKDNLDQTLSQIRAERKYILKAIIAEAGESNSAVREFAAALKQYLPANDTTARPGAPGPKPQ